MILLTIVRGDYVFSIFVIFFVALIIFFFSKWFSISRNCYHVRALGWAICGLYFGELTDKNGKWKQYILTENTLKFSRVGEGVDVKKGAEGGKWKVKEEVERTVLWRQGLSYEAYT